MADKGLVNYIARSLGQGMPKEAIVETLTKQGRWSVADVDAAFAEASAVKEAVFVAPIPESRQEARKYWLSGLLIFAAALAFKAILMRTMSDEVVQVSGIAYDLVTMVGIVIVLKILMNIFSAGYLALPKSIFFTGLTYAVAGVGTIFLSGLYVVSGLSVSFPYIDVAIIQVIELVILTFIARSLFGIPLAKAATAVAAVILVMIMVAKAAESLGM